MKETKEGTARIINRSAPPRRKFSKVYYFLVLLLAAAALCAFAPTAYAEPSGSWTDEGNYDISWYNEEESETTYEYDINSAEELAGLAYLVNNGKADFADKIVRLRAAVDMSAHYWEPIGTYRLEFLSNITNNISTSFNGTFDGGRHEISGIFVKRIEGSMKSVYAGFFGCIQESKNPANSESVSKSPLLIAINIVNATIEGSTKECSFQNPFWTSHITNIEPLAAGIVAYFDRAGAIRDCTFSGTVDGYDAAGIVGMNRGYQMSGGGNTIGCVNMGAIKAVHYAGGIVARTGFQSSTTKCVNEGQVFSKEHAAGGIAGANGMNTYWGDGTINYCANAGPVQGEVYSGAIVGETRSSYDYTTSYYWISDEETNTAEKTVGNKDAQKPANMVETRADLPPTVMIFDFTNAPYGRYKGLETNGKVVARRYIYPEDGVYTLSPAAVYPTGSKTAENIVITVQGDKNSISLTNLTKEMYSKPFKVCVTKFSERYFEPGKYNVASDSAESRDDDRSPRVTGGLLSGYSNFHLNLEKVVKVPTITLEDVTIKNGESVSLTAAFDPETPSAAQDLTWSSDNEDVAVVDASGKVTAISVGQARITAKSAIFETAEPAECVVTVNKDGAPVKVDSVTLSETAVELKAGDTKQLSASVLPASVSQAVKWESSNAGVASVDASGLVTAVAEGSAEITATSAIDAAKFAVCAVTVTASGPQPQPVTAVTLDRTEVTLEPAGWAELKATVQPENAAQTVNWTSSDEKVATVNDKGKVTAVAAGTATIKAASTEDGTKFAECVVTVAVMAKPEAQVPNIGESVNIPDGVDVNEKAEAFASKAEAEEAISSSVPLEQKGNAVYPTQAAADNAVRESLEEGETLEQNVYRLPVFSIVTSSPTAAAGWVVDGAALLTDKIEDVDIRKIISGQEVKKFAYDASGFKDGTFMILKEDGTQAAGDIDKAAKYMILLCIADNGGFDLNKAEGEIADPAVIVRTSASSTPNPWPGSAPSGGGSGGGCSAGWGALALLAIVPLFARRKK